MSEIKVHPAALNLAYGILLNAVPGTLGLAIAGGDIVDAIVAAADPRDPWPNPWILLSPAEREYLEANSKHPIDPDARVTLKLTSEQVVAFKTYLEQYGTKAPIAQGKVLKHLAEVLV